MSYITKFSSCCLLTLLASIMLLSCCPACEQSELEQIPPDPLKYFQGKVFLEIKPTDEKGSVGLVEIEKDSYLRYVLIKDFICQKDSSIYFKINFDNGIPIASNITQELPANSLIETDVKYYKMVNFPVHNSLDHPEGLNQHNKLHKIKNYNSPSIDLISATETAKDDYIIASRDGSYMNFKASLDSANDTIIEFSVPIPSGKTFEQYRDWLWNQYLYTGTASATFNAGDVFFYREFELGETGIMQAHLSSIHTH